MVFAYIINNVKNKFGQDKLLKYMVKMLSSNFFPEKKNRKFYLTKKKFSPQKLAIVISDRVKFHLLIAHTKGRFNKQKTAQTICINLSLLYFVSYFLL